MKFRLFVLILTVAGIATSITLAQNIPAHKPAPKKAVTKKAATKNVVRKSSVKKRTVTKRVAAQPRQSAPSPDRYKEIQDALASKGYLKSDSNGVWDAQSVDAMKRYQTDQKQEPTGKLTAASLIGLGLGPKTALISTPAPAPESIPVPQR
jgi:hypothetical protein